jgi:hypothetical protein
VDAKTVRLVSGASPAVEQGVCLEQLVSLLANEPFSDHPFCVDVLVIRWGMHVNDSADDDGRSRLYPYAARQIGTASDGRMDERALVCCDWLFRVLLADGFAWEHYTEAVRLLRELPPIDSLASLQRAVDETRALVIRPGDAVETVLDLAYEVATEVEAALAHDGPPGTAIPYCDHPGRTKIELLVDAVDELVEITELVAVAWEQRLDLLDRMLPPAPTVDDLAFERCANVPGLEALAS